MAKSNATNFASTKQFPDNFLLGTATGAFQVEGAWDEDKSPHIWDDYFHNQSSRKYKYSLNMPPLVIKEYKDNGVEPRLVDIYKGMAVYEVPKTAVALDDINYNYNGDVAADTYHKTDTDIELLKELGVKVYKFSFSYSRIFPDMHDHKIGEAGVKYYNNLIDKLVENGITPMVLMYNFDLPLSTDKIGGLTNATFRSFGKQYVRFCFGKFGDRVKHWIFCPDLHQIGEGYGSEHFAPGYQESVFSGYMDYLVVYNILETCAVAARIYNDEFKEEQQGQVSLTIDGTWYYPQDPKNPEHQKCSEFACLSTFGMIAYAIATGQFPTEVLKAIEKISDREQLSIGRLQQYTKEQQETIKGAFDFIVFNYYGSVKVRPLTDEEFSNEPNLKRRDRGFLIDFENVTQDEVYEGFLNCLKYINQVMNGPKIFIGENGFPEDEGIDDSQKKIAYHTGILNKLLEALDNKIDVFGYCVWSFIDTLEFTFGYGKKFGIYAVDFNDDSRPRSKKNSFPFFQQLFQTKRLPVNNFYKK